MIKPMTTNKDSDFQNQFIKLAVRRLPHHILLAMTSKHTDRGLTRLLNNYAARSFLKDTTISQQYSEAEIKQYTDVAKAAQYWHGTGRYHHDDDRLMDVLTAIITHGGLKPAYDAYAIFSAGTVMHSISLTTRRIIARSYADMHGKGYKEPNRYGDALTWASYYYGLFYAKLYTLNAVKLRRHWKRWHSLTHDENGDNTWGKKVNKQAKDVWDIFCLGSDIPGNYPIVIGVKNIKSQVDFSSVFAAYEVRTLETVMLDDISHFEVPDDKVAVTQQILASHGCTLPVFAIELGETVAATQTFGDLLGLSPR